MSKRPNRYKLMVRNMTITIMVNLVFFLVFLIAAGNSIVWLKVISFIMILIISSLCLAVLYLSKELLRQRSIWMTVASFAILACTLFSLILRFPSPNPMKQEIPSASITETINQ